MIDLKTFAAKMTILADRFGRTKLLDETLAMYFDALNQKLSTAEFVEACRVIFEQDTYWPSPRRFVEAVKGDPKAEGEAAWDRLAKLVSQGDSSRWPLDLMGTLRELGKTQGDMLRITDSELDRLRPRFIAAFVRSAEPAQTALPGVAELAR